MNQADINSIQAKINNQLNKSSTLLRVGFHIFDNTDFSKLPEYQNRNPLELQYSKLDSISIEQTKEPFKKWLIERGLEELIKAANIGLIEMNILLKMNQEAGLSEESLYKTYSAMHIPSLFEKLEKDFNVHLEYKRKLLSINNARNCLMHYEGIVVEKYCNSEGVFVLEWEKLFIFTEIDGVEVEVINGSVVTGAIKLKSIECRKEFKVGQNIDLELKEYEELLTTIGVFFCADIEESLNL